jgi:hypothetical protein
VVVGSWKQALQGKAGCEFVATAQAATGTSCPVLEAAKLTAVNETTISWSLTTGPTPTGTNCSGSATCTSNTATYELQP